MYIQLNYDYAIDTTKNIFTNFRDIQIHPELQQHSVHPFTAKS